MVKTLETCFYNYYMKKMEKVIHWNCLEVLRRATPNSIDAIVTDPPYWLSFMGKKWDYDVPSVEIWQECLRVLKPGGYLLAFAGTRTQHRMAVRIEDAGFEIRDMIAWVYGSGFPKSLNIGKAVDKLQGNEREDLGEHIQNKTNPDSKNRSWQSEEGVGNKWNLSKGTSEWEGWWTALKPALEPITVARKPISEKTVAENCLKWGVGGINIDESRVEAQKGDKFGGGGLNSPVNGFMGNTENTYKKGTGFRDDTALGRFPANLIHDNSEEVRECFPESKGALAPVKAGLENKMFGANKPTVDDGKSFRNDSGNASRFFKSIIYQAKASKSERNKGCEELEEKRKKVAVIQTPWVSNDWEWEDWKQLSSPMKNHHPTVKPIALMEYLVKLVSREWALVLDPFAWSGSTLLACKNLGRGYVGIEMDEEYIKIINARLWNTL